MQINAQYIPPCEVQLYIKPRAVSFCFYLSWSLFLGCFCLCRGSRSPPRDITSSLIVSHRERSCQHTTNLRIISQLFACMKARLKIFPWSEPIFLYSLMVFGFLSWQFSPCLKSVMSRDSEATSIFLTHEIRFFICYYWIWWNRCDNLNHLIKCAIWYLLEIKWTSFKTAAAWRRRLVTP